MPRKIHVANLSHTTQKDELSSLFTIYGAVTAAQVIDRLKTGSQTITAFVEMATVDQSESAIRGLNGSTHRGQKLVVAWATPGQAVSLNLSRMFEPTDVRNDPQDR